MHYRTRSRSNTSSGGGGGGRREATCTYRMDSKKNIPLKTAISQFGWRLGLVLRFQQSPSRRVIELSARKLLCSLEILRSARVFGLHRPGSWPKGTLCCCSYAGTCLALCLGCHHKFLTVRCIQSSGMHGCILSRPKFLGQVLYTHNGESDQKMKKCMETAV